MAWWLTTHQHYQHSTTSTTSTTTTTTTTYRIVLANFSLLLFLSSSHSRPPSSSVPTICRSLKFCLDRLFISLSPSTLYHIRHESWFRGMTYTLKNLSVPHDSLSPLADSIHVIIIPSYPPLVLTALWLNFHPSFLSYFPLSRPFGNLSSLSNLTYGALFLVCTRFTRK